MRRADRWRLLDAARPVTGLKRLRECRLATLTRTGGPILRTSPGGAAGYAGLATCGSVWACPCCSAKIAAARASDLAAVMGAVHAAGGFLDLVTLTLRHHKGQRLRDLWDAVSAAWGSVTSGRAWVADSAGMLGFARVVEVTNSPSAGWHVHVHALIAWAGPVDEDESQRVAFRAWLRWDRALRRRGLDSTPVRGVDSRRVRSGDDGLAGYFVKAATELTSAYSKDSRGGRTPFAILADATETYRADDLELWWEFEQASHARRQLTWSTGRSDLRRFAGLDRERTDDELAAEETGGDDAIVLPWETWTVVSRAREQPELLAVATEGGLAAATAWLDVRGLGWHRARPRPGREGPRPRSPQVRREAREVLTASEWSGRLSPCRGLRS